MVPGRAPSCSPWPAFFARSRAGWRSEASPVERRDELAYRRRVGLVLADPLLLGCVGVRQRRLRPPVPRGARRRGRRPGRPLARPAGHRAPARPARAADLERRGAAGRPGPGVRPRAGPAAARRAVRLRGRRDAGAAPGRSRRSPADDARRLRPGDPRPGRGRARRRPPGRPPRRPDPPGGSARGGARGAGRRRGGGVRRGGDADPGQGRGKRATASRPSRSAITGSRPSPRWSAVAASSAACARRT